jgi:3-phosphoshikimate 1-carboxyvinyltransferase
MKLSDIFLGESKSFANRVLIISSFSDKKDLPEFHSKADDIVELRSCLDDLSNGIKEFTIGEGGTTFRFLLTRLSRENGIFVINAKPQLLKRPNQELYNVLESLGAKITANKNSVKIQANGWKKLESLDIDCEKSTQFASAILLCSFGLTTDLILNFLNFNKSITYLEMTKTIVKSSGLKFDITQSGVKIAKQSKVNNLPFAEPDMSSAFSIATMGVVNGPINLKNIPKNSIQGDSVFIDILKKMNIDLSFEGEGELIDLIIRPSDKITPIEVDLCQCPDLLPVLSSLCALSSGTSKITGIAHTRFKESDRIEKSLELVSKAGAKATATDVLMTITGPVDKNKSFDFDPDNDHRMAMAAALLKAYGLNIRILHPEVVNKSYPNFWIDSKVTP